MKEYKTTVEGLWGVIKSGDAKLDKRTELIRQAFCDAERMFNIGFLMTGQMKEKSATDHFYDGDAPASNKVREALEYIENEAKCIITSKSNTITGIVFRVW